MPHHDLVHKFIPVPQADEHSGCESSSGQGMGEARERFQPGSCRN